MVYTTFEIEDELKTIVEVGAHCGSEALALSQKYPDARIITYEADPGKWSRIEDKLNTSEVIFRKKGLGDRVDERMFYRFIGYENDGADSF